MVDVLRLERSARRGVRVRIPLPVLVESALASRRALSHMKFIIKH